ncbi:MAG: glycerophosphodiester phosphodiesterase family protein [Sciscionella sp.]
MSATAAAPVCDHALVQPVLVAHRGASAHRAEHTLRAYELALQQGATGLECDVRVTRDGHLVCLHDRRVDRTSTGSGVVSELTLDELTRLDFAHWHDEWPDSAEELIAQRAARPRGSPGVLTLPDLLGLVRDHADPVLLFVETKHPVRYGGLVEARLRDTLQHFGLADPRTRRESPVVMMSFSSRAVRRFRSVAPAIPTVLLFADFSAARRSGALPQEADIAGPSIALLRADPGYVARAAARGHETYCWTVDRPADVRLCHRLGVAYVATNTPASAHRLLR